MTLHELPDARGCACNDIDGGLVSFETALQRGLALSAPVAETELLALDDATGRVLAEPIHALCAIAKSLEVARE